MKAKISARGFFKRIPLIAKLFFTYMLVLIVPMSSISYLLYHRLVTSYGEQAHQTMMLSLSAVDERHSIWRTFIENMSIMIALDEKTRTLGEAKLPVDAIFESRSYMLLLNTLQITYGIVDSIYVYIEDMETVYTSLRKQYKIDVFQDTSWMEYTSDGAQWIGVRSVPTANSLAADSTTNYITYLRHINPRFMVKDGYVVININESDMYKMLTKELDMQLYVLDSSGVIISCPDKAMLGTDYDDPAGVLGQSLAKNGESVTLRFKDDSQTTMFAGAYKSRGGIHYVGIIDDSVYVNQIKAMTSFLTIVCAACFLLGIPICYFLSKTMYSPIARLASRIDTSALSGEVDEIVRRSLGNIVSKNSWLASLLGGSRRNDGFTNSVLTGEAVSSEKETILKQLFLPYIVVLNISVDEPFFCNVNEELLTYLDQFLFELFDNTITTNHKVYTARIGEHAVALALSFESEEPFESLDEIIAQVKKRLYLFFTGTITVSYSHVKHSLNALPEALAEAEKAMRWKLRAGCDSIIPYNSDMDGAVRFYYPRDHVNKVSAALSAHEDAALDEAITQLFEHMQESDADTDSLLMVYHQIIGRLIQHMTTRNIKPNDVYSDDEAALYPYLSRFETMQSINGWIRGLLLRCREFDRSYVLLKNRYITSLAAYVQENYAKELIPTEVAEKIGISYSYMRRLLNTEMQTNFIDYVNSIRLAHAKRLMDNTDMLIKEIARETGFTNEQSFTRAFKKSEGMSPGMYRRDLKPG